MGRSCQLNHKDNETIKIHLHSLPGPLVMTSHLWDTKKRSGDGQAEKNGQLKCDFRPLRGGRERMGSKRGGKKDEREKLM